MKQLLGRLSEELGDTVFGGPDEQDRTTHRLGPLRPPPPPSVIKMSVWDANEYCPSKCARMHHRSLAWTQVIPANILNELRESGTVQVVDNS